MESWYFAYGSNLSTDQMVARTGTIARGEQGPKIAHLAGYQIVFQHVAGSESAFANIVAPGEGVLGVVYRLEQKAFAILDAYEHGYERRRVTVVDQCGESLAAVAYMVSATAGGPIGAPSAEYLARIVAGAHDHNLPAEYIAAIVACAGRGIR